MDILQVWWPLAKKRKKILQKTEGLSWTSKMWVLYLAIPAMFGARSFGILINHQKISAAMFLAGHDAGNIASEKEASRPHV